MNKCLNHRHTEIAQSYMYCSFSSDGCPESGTVGSGEGKSCSFPVLMCLFYYKMHLNHLFITNLRAIVLNILHNEQPCLHKERWCWS